MTISHRARVTDGEPALAKAHLAAARDPWSETNPGGYLNLGTAENHLLFDLLEPRLTAARPITAADTRYQDLQGMASFRTAIARFLTRQRGVAVDPEHLVVLSGGTAALDALAYALCDPDDGIVLPTPYYAGLDAAFAGRAGAAVVPAPMSSADGFALNGSVIEHAIARARAGGRPLRAVALISPHNPLGHVYSADTLRSVAEVVTGQGLQLVVDEVYAGSVYDGEFVSAASLPADVVAPERLHLVWGFAKDFGLSGYKVGVLHSTDPGVLAAARRLATLAPVSSDTQVLLRDLLADDEWTARLMAENRSRLAAAHRRTTTALDRGGIGYGPAGAGLFLWIDLRPHLAEPTFEAENVLWHRLFTGAKLNITPGGVFHATEPGWFRICFAVPDTHLTPALTRLTTSLPPT